MSLPLSLPAGVIPQLLAERISRACDGIAGRNDAAGRNDVLSVECTQRREDDVREDDNKSSLQYQCKLYQASERPHSGTLSKARVCHEQGIPVSRPRSSQSCTRKAVSRSSSEAGRCSRRPQTAQERSCSEAALACRPQSTQKASVSRPRSSPSCTRKDAVKGQLTSDTYDNRPVSASTCSLGRRSVSGVQTSCEIRIRPEDRERPLPIERCSQRTPSLAPSSRPSSGATCSQGRRASGAHVVGGGKAQSDVREASASFVELPESLQLHDCMHSENNSEVQSASTSQSRRRRSVKAADSRGRSPAKLSSQRLASSSKGRTPSCGNSQRPSSKSDSHSRSHSRADSRRHSVAGSDSQSRGYSQSDIYYYPIEARGVALSHNMAGRQPSAPLGYETSSQVLLGDFPAVAKSMAPGTFQLVRPRPEDPFRGKSVCWAMGNAPTRRSSGFGQVAGLGGQRFMRCRSVNA